ncbi:MAG: C40 family peptidase, partial [Deltaproteobacteria bacterium]|nr:C40 family peptidase [Deltaproteobacteria bacterium]
MNKLPPQPRSIALAPHTPVPERIDTVKAGTEYAVHSPTRLRTVIRNRSWPRSAALAVAIICLSPFTFGCGESSKKSATPLSASESASSSDSAVSKKNTTAPPDASCPETAVHRGAFPNVRAPHNTAAYWQNRWSSEALDTPLLTTEDIRAHNRAVGHSGQPPVSQWDLLTPMPQTVLEAELKQRLSAMVEAVKSNTYVTDTGSPLPPPDIRYISRESGQLRRAPQPSLWFTAIQPILMRCAPYNGALFTADTDRAFDKNACSTIQNQEPFEVLGQWRNGMLFVRTRYAFGFIPPDSPHSPDVPTNHRQTYMNGQMAFIPDAITVACENETVPILARTIVPLRSSDSLLLAHASGFCSAPIPKGAVLTARPLTRRAFYQTAFQYLGADYGYGGSENGLDCSRFVMNVLSTFQLAMPRNSKHQSMAGAFSIDVGQIRDPAQKLKYLNLASQRGIVAIYFPGHIMFYLGETEAGVPMAIHALGEYAKPCNGASGAETVFRVKKVVVTDLSCGLGSSRRSFLERATRIVVFGANPGDALQSIVTHRAAESPVLPAAENCEDTVERRIFQSPRRLITDEPARLIATTATDPGRATLRIYDPSGR